MKKTLLLFSVSILLGIPFSTTAQDADTTYWKKTFRAGLNFNQASFSDEWTGGGVNSIGLSAYLNYKANYARGLNTWDNEIDLGYGVVKNDGQSARKAVDRIYLDTKYGRKLNDKWSLFSSLNLLTQFVDGYSYDEVRADGVTEYDSLISTLFAPAFITSAWGLEYKPVDHFSLRVSPFAPRMTIVADDRLANTPNEDDPTKGAYGVDLGDNVRTEWLAFQLQADFDKKIAENLTLKWKYLLYLNYETMDFDRWDHRLDLLLSASVNKFMNVTLGGTLIYDYDQVDAVQLSQQLTLGIAYSFQNFKE